MREYEMPILAIMGDWVLRPLPHQEHLIHCLQIRKMLTPKIQDRYWQKKTPVQLGVSHDQLIMDDSFAKSRTSYQNE